MLCRNFKQILSPNTPDKRYFISTRHFSRQWINIVFSRNGHNTNMSSPLKLRHIFRDLFLARLLAVWTRNGFVSSVVRRCRKDGRVREVIHCFRQALLRPRRTLVLTVTAAYKNNEEKPGPPGPCATDITDQELVDLLIDLEAMEDLCKATLYCSGCEQRVVIDNAQPGIRYCKCDKTKSPEHNFDGWEPFLEAEEIIIWRKEYKPGPLYAYKVYGRYKTLNAEDFAAIQVDGRYRKFWDTGVASLTVVEHEANGKSDQDVLHWEVVWPRFFTNRDYVYLRRHKAFDIKNQPHSTQHKDRVFDKEPPTRDVAIEIHERPNVHSNAKRKALEDEAKEEQYLKEETLTDNKVYVIVSRSCTHEKVPVRNTVRVAEYWSHMVVKTTHGLDKPGMEFVLTYYDEAIVGGLPTALTSWAMSRAGPAFLQRMRLAAHQYRHWKTDNPPKSGSEPDFSPFTSEKVSPEKVGPEKISPEKVDPEEISPEKISPEKISPEKISPEKISPRKNSPEKISPEQISPEKISPEKISPEKISPQKNSPEKISPEKISPEKISPDKFSDKDCPVCPKVVSPKKPCPEKCCTCPENTKPQKTSPPKASPETSSEEPVGNEDSCRRDQATQTTGTVVFVELERNEPPDNVQATPLSNTSDESVPNKPFKTVNLDNELQSNPVSPTEVTNNIEGDSCTPESTEDEKEREDPQSWWRYLYPFYYFS